jgi:hypothetical protein
VRKADDRQLAALRAIQADDQGQGGDLDIFEARECEGMGWVTKIDGAYRLTEAGKRLLEDRQLSPAVRRISPCTPIRLTCSTVQAVFTRKNQGDRVAQNWLYSCS